MKGIRLIDTHSHINFEHFDERREEVMKNYSDVGGNKMVLVGCGKNSSERAVKFAEMFEGYIATVGVHPTSLDDLTDEFLEWCRAQIISGKAHAIGETGLDYYHMSYSREEQIEALKKQAALAVELDVPVIIHSRDKGMVSSKIDIVNKQNPGAVGPCGRDCLETLQELNVKKAIFHCYSYDLEFAKEVWGQGYLTSFSGIVTYPKNQYLREVATHAPSGQFLIETDCPYLSPQSKRGQENEPAFVLETAKEVAKLRGMSIAELSELTAMNAENIFNF